MTLAAIRGAITVETNDGEEIEKAAVRLFEEVMHSNNLLPHNMVFILFTSTGDLDSAYPAAGIRKAGYTAIPMLCAAEMTVKGSLERCIRVMVLANVEENQRVRHVYMDGAKKLRPDLSDR